MLGYSVELYGDAVESLALHDRVTIASMATEMGAITLLFPPDEEVLNYCEKRAGHSLTPVFADADASYEKEYTLDVSRFVTRVSLPGKPHDTIPLINTKQIKIDSGFVGSCTNGSIEDMRAVAEILKNRKVAPGVVLKIVPTTDHVWMQCLEEGLIKIFKEAGALVSNAGCAGCAAGQVGQNGPGEVTISSGNRNFPGKQGKGEVYLASPAVVAASVVAGYITTPEKIPDRPLVFSHKSKDRLLKESKVKKVQKDPPVVFSGRIWLISRDNIDTDMIYHNRYLAITDQKEMGKYAFDNLKGFEHFARQAKPGDIIITGKNFGSGSSRQQAVDCFKALGISAILARSFGVIYERNAINAAFPVLTYTSLEFLELKTGQEIWLDIAKGEIMNPENGKTLKINPFSEVQMEIYKNGGLF